MRYWNGYKPSWKLKQIRQLCEESSLEITKMWTSIVRGATNLKMKKARFAEANDGADDNPPFANNAKNTHEEPKEEEVLPPNDLIPVLPHKQKFCSLTDALDNSKHVDPPPQRPKTYTYTNAKKTMTIK